MEQLLTLAGFDPSGGAGILMDIKMFTLLGFKGAGVPTALTFQNSQTFQGWIALHPNSYEKMLKLILEDLSISGVKLGMLATPELVSLTSFYLKKYKSQIKWIVYDPVLKATLNYSLFEGESFLQAITKELFPLLDFLTPNIEEAEILSSKSIKDRKDLKEVAKIIKSKGVRHLLIKGLIRRGRICSYYYGEGEDSKCYSTKALPFEFHGTGCALSSLLLGYLIKIKDPEKALSLAIKKTFSIS